MYSDRVVYCELVQYREPFRSIFMKLALTCRRALFYSKGVRLTNCLHQEKWWHSTCSDADECINAAGVPRKAATRVLNINSASYSQSRSRTDAVVTMLSNNSLADPDFSMENVGNGVQPTPNKVAVVALQTRAICRNYCFDFSSGAS